MYARWFMTALATTSLGSALALAADWAPVASGDWPGWRGPERTGVSRETGLLHQWPPGGPKLLWKAKGLGGGYSTPSIAGGRFIPLAVPLGQPHPPVRLQPWRACLQVRFRNQPGPLQGPFGS